MMIMNVTRSRVLNFIASSLLPVTPNRYRPGRLPHPDSLPPAIYNLSALLYHIFLRKV